METVAFRPEGMPPPAANYSPVVRRGGIVAVSGQIAFSPGSHDEATVPGITDQARQVFANVGQLLEAAGSSFAEVIMIRIFLKREGDFAAMNAVFNETFAEPYPARTTVWVDLPGGLLIEADALAVSSA
jgi:2-iminobutanoate/2-iminopropanoate deaminase